MRKLILNIIIICYLCVNSFAQQVNFSATIDKDSILIGDHINLILKAEIDKSIKYTWPALADTFSNFEIVERAKIDTSNNAGNVLLQQYIVVTSFESGSQVLPPFQLLYAEKNDTTQKAAFTNALKVDVYTVPVDTTAAIKDIKAPVKVPLTLAEILPYLLALIPLLILAWALYYWFKNKGKMEVKGEPVVYITPYDEAIKNLRKLEKEKLWQNGEIKKYYSELSDILRIYLEKQFHVNAMEQTTDDILIGIVNKPEIKNHQRLLKQVLSTSDLVKFAKYQPLPDENSLSLKNSYDFVQQTKPAPVHEPELKGGAA